jgi:hypothetical protein
MHSIEKNGCRLAVKFGLEDIQQGLSFFSEDADFLQVGTWRYGQGKQLAAHIHNVVERTVLRTQEFIYVVKGGVKASIYDPDHHFLEDIVLAPQEGLILYEGGHGYEILEEDTVVIEVKNGPYVGAELDRQRLEEG